MGRVRWEVVRDRGAWNLEHLGEAAGHFGEGEFGKLPATG